MGSQSPALGLPTTPGGCAIAALGFQRGPVCNYTRQFNVTRLADERRPLAKPFAAR